MRQEVAHEEVQEIAQKKPRLFSLTCSSANELYSLSQLALCKPYQY
jgi:chemotaxis methyl-accepting protein methylase